MHPVLALLRSRHAARSLPGQRTDGQSLVLIVEGGGMRGVVSAAMTAELEAHGLTACFDHVVGCSSGALNAAAFIAGVARACCSEYHGAFTSRQFINPVRLLWGRPAIDVSFALNYAGAQLDAERHQRALDSPIPLHCVATDVERAAPAVLSRFESLEELNQALLASSRLPWIGGTAVSFRGRRYFDGGLVQAVPLPTALALGATHVLVLQTRPEGVRYPRRRGFMDRLAERQLRALNPRLVDLYRGRAQLYDEVYEEIARRERDTLPPFVRGIRLPARTLEVSRLERDPLRLESAAREARRAARELIVAPVLGGDVLGAAGLGAATHGAGHGLAALGEMGPSDAGLPAGAERPLPRPPGGAAMD